MISARWAAARARLFCCSAALLLLAGAASLITAQPSAYTGNETRRRKFLLIMRAEDERRADAQLLALLTDRDMVVRRRAALAAGRIGAPDSVASLAALLTEADEGLRATAAFALGETEAPAAIEALVALLRRPSEMPGVRARAVEALGKIAATLDPATAEDTERRRAASDEISAVLAEQSRRGAAAARELTLAALTAALRARLKGESVAPFLASTDARVRADAANTLARLRAKEAGPQLLPLLADADPDVRANAARALGAAEHREALDGLLKLVHADPDERVRVSAVRALASLKEARAGETLLARAARLLPAYRRAKEAGIRHPREINELLEIAAALGRIFANTADGRVIALCQALRSGENLAAPEVEIAYARVAPRLYLDDAPFPELRRSSRALPPALRDWHAVSAVAQALGEVAQAGGEAARDAVREKIITLLELSPALSLPDLLRAYAALKTEDAGAQLARRLSDRDVIVRATAAELLGELPPSAEHTRQLAAALPVSLTEDPLNDAALAILEALAKQKNATATAAIESALAARDHLIRRRAVNLLRANGAGDFTSKIGPVATGHDTAFYEEALARAGRRPRALIFTDKGRMTIELLPEEAPLTVDNFIRLARRGFFNGLTFHRVVPNFVIQGGDPRGDGNGGPSSQIRCEINEVPYERGAVGMALSGKDTGGSQWFVTHAPQPHLDGGYTVFGRVVAGMPVVDAIARGDRIQRVRIIERSGGRRGD